MKETVATENKKIPYKAENVAHYLVFLASRENQEKQREGVTNLKLQKVLYLSQAYYLAKLGKPLFAEKLEAWELGPVIPEVYRKRKHYGSKPIISEKDKSILVEKDKETLKGLWDTFGGYSASRLVDVVHSHTPWKEAYVSVNKVISQKAIKDYYTPLLNK